MADTKRLYRLTSSLSRQEEGGRKIYGVGETVRLTPTFAKRIGAVQVEYAVESTSEGQTGQKSPASTNTNTGSKPSGDTDWSTLSTLSYEDAVSLVNSATSTDQLKEAREAETGTGGKRRRSVVEAITAKEKELAGDSK